MTTDGHAFNGTISSNGHGEVTSSAFSFTDNIATSAPVGVCELTFIANGSGYKMYNESKGYLYAQASSSGNLEWHNSETSYWSNKSSNWTYESNNAYLRSYNNTFRTYGTNIGNVLLFAQKITNITFTDYCTNVVTLSSIAVSGTLSKTEYTVRETFDPTGLTVTGTYSNGDETTITEGISWSWTPSTFEAPGNQPVSVTATVKSIKSAAYNVNVTVNTIDNTLAATDKSINVNTNLDVKALFTTNSNAEIKYTLVENPSDAGTLTGTIFSATAAGTYTVKAIQAATTTHSAAEATATIIVSASKSYQIVFNTASTDGSTEISSSTKISTVVSQGTDYIASFTGNCKKAYYNGKQGVKLGTGSAVGTLEFNLAEVVKNNVISIEVETAKYGSDTGTISLFYNGNTALESEKKPGDNFTHTFTSPTTVKSLKFTTSTKRAYISKITITVSAN